MPINSNVSHQISISSFTAQVLEHYFLTAYQILLDDQQQETLWNSLALISQVLDT